MLIILPPSETKAHGGSGAPLDLDALSFPALNPVREKLAKELSSLPVEEAMDLLKLSEKLRGEAASNTQLFSSPTMPALERFTGVLYDALDAPSLPPAARARLAVGDALFGLVHGDDLIPHYRLSGGTKLGGATLKSRWGRAITEELGGIGKLLVDLRSGTYQALGRAPKGRAVTVRVESVQPDGTRKVVSHFNKHYKGQLARVLALADAAPGPISATDGAQVVADIATAAGMTTEVRGEEVMLVV